MNPVVAQETLHIDAKSVSAQQTEQKQTFQKVIAETLEARGLETEAAEKIICEYVGDEAVLEVMVNNIVQVVAITKEDIVAYLGNEALFRRRVDLTSYDALLKMVGTITQSIPDTAIRAELKQLSGFHSTLSV
jgi:hypothetical protein